jgi:hypothetical protein
MFSKHLVPRKAVWCPDAVQVKAAQVDILRLEKEVSQMYRDKSRLLEELVVAGADLSTARKQVQALEAQLAQVRDPSNHSFIVPKSVLK